MKNAARINQSDAGECKCAGYHSGSHALTVTGDGKHAECNGCMTHYSASDILAAIDGITKNELGQGGVMLDLD